MGCHVTGFCSPFCSASKTKGTVVHAWLEGLPWLEETPSLSVLVERARELGATEAEAATWADSFLASLARPTLSSLLRRPTGAVEVRVEQPFQMMVEPGVSFAQRTVNERALMSGSMDRMVIYREEARVVRVEVIDYKTDVLKSSDEETIAGRARFYAPQLAVYRMAASRLVGCPIGCVTTGLMLLHLDRMEWTSS